MQQQVLWIIAGIGVLTLGVAVFRMKDGFGPFNLRVIGIILVATLSSILAISDGGSITSAMGILGAIAGYLFGIKDST